MKKHSAIFFIFFLFALISLACQTGGQAGPNVYAASLQDQQPQKLISTPAVLSGHKLEVMLARTDTEKSRGLMFFTDLAENHGMLFVYEAPRPMSFWMKNTRIPLDLVFFSPDLVITEWIEGMEPGYGHPEFSLPRYTAKNPAQYALELKAGSVVRMGLKPGDRLEIPLTLLYSE